MTFRYWRDPLFLVCLLTYLFNRWIIKPFTDAPFFHNYLNDLMCIPIWVPPMLWGMRLLKLRTNDAPPQTFEVVVPLIVWALCFEVVLPQQSFSKGWAHADVNDVLAYISGAVLAAIFWKTYYRKPAPIEAL